MARKDLLIARQCNRLVHEPIRLALLSLLAAGYEADFVFLRTALGVTDGNLSSHLKTLLENGYITTRKRFIDGRPNSRYQISEKGRKEYEKHRAALIAVLDSATKDGPS